MGKKRERELAVWESCPQLFLCFLLSLSHSSPAIYKPTPFNEENARRHPAQLPIKDLTCVILE